MADTKRNLTLALENEDKSTIETICKALSERTGQSTSIGDGALNSDDGTSNFNVGVGYRSLFSNVSGYFNGACGYQSLYNNTSGIKNTGIGYQALYNITTGINNTGLGFNAQPTTSTANNEITLGDANIATLRCATTTITALSDKRDKSNITPCEIGLDFINSLRVVEFDWNTRDGSRQNRGKQIGFIAQELDEASKEIESIRNKGLIMTENPEKLEIGESALIPSLVKSIQDLSKEIETLKAKQCKI